MSPLVSCITLRKKNCLVVEPNPLKNMRTVKLDHFARDLGWKFQKVFELPPPRKFDDHHLKFLGLMFYLPVAEFRPQKINGWNLKVTHLERKIIFQPSFSSPSWNIRPLRSQFPSTGISSWKIETWGQFPNDFGDFYPIATYLPLAPYLPWLVVKICSSNWESSPQFWGVKIPKKKIETTNHLYTCKVHMVWFPAIHVDGWNVWRDVSTFSAITPEMKRNINGP